MTTTCSENKSNVILRSGNEDDKNPSEYPDMSKYTISQNQVGAPVPKVNKSKEMIKNTTRQIPLHTYT